MCRFLGEATFGGGTSIQRSTGARTDESGNYILVSSISSLASAIAANSSGAFALASNYDASADGTYNASPIQTTFTGSFEGLENNISHLSIDASGFVGLFSAERGAVDNLGVLHATIKIFGGAVAGVISSEGFGGYLSHVVVTGTISGQGNAIGELSGGGSVIKNCYSDVRISDHQTLRPGSNRRCSRKRVIRAAN